RQGLQGPRRAAPGPRPGGHAGPGRGQGPARAGQAYQTGGRRVQRGRGLVAVSQFRFLKNKDDYYRHFTALDIGSDLVKSLVVRREAPNGMVLGVSREPQHPDAMAGGAIANVDLVIDACNRALEAAE